MAIDYCGACAVAGSACPYHPVVGLASNELDYNDKAQRLGKSIFQDAINELAKLPPGLVFNDRDSLATISNASDAALAAEIGRRGSKFILGSEEIVAALKQHGLNLVTDALLDSMHKMAAKSAAAHKTVKFETMAVVRQTKKCVYVGGSRYCKAHDEWHN